MTGELTVRALDNLNVTLTDLHQTLQTILEVAGSDAQVLELRIGQLESRIANLEKGGVGPSLQELMKRIDVLERITDGGDDECGDGREV